jgi:hypothetical protein
MTPEEIWVKATQNPPDTPHYQKLVMLAQLKTADVVARYTKWLTVITALVGLSTFLQAIFAFLTWYRIQ